MSGHASKIANKRGRPSLKQAALMNMKEYEHWQCQQCRLGAHSTYMLRSGPGGDKTLCNFCGLHYAVHGRLPEDRKDLFRFNIENEEETTLVVPAEVTTTAVTAAVAIASALYSTDASAVASPAMDATWTTPGTPIVTTPMATPVSD